MAKQKILVVDDDTKTCELIRMQLDMAGYDAVCAHDGKEALSVAKEFAPNLMILDVMLPEVDGMEVLREVRRSTNLPVIMVTGRNEEFDRVLGLEMGADDYVTKPFSLRELIARVKAVLRRSGGSQPAPEQQILNLPGIYVNLLSREVRINDQRVDMTPKEFDLLWHLARNRDRVFSRDDLLKQVWAYQEFFGDERTVDQHVKRLRRKVQADHPPCRIITIWGVGYKFELCNGSK